MENGGRGEEENRDGVGGRVDYGECGEDQAETVFVSDTEAAVGAREDNREGEIKIKIETESKVI